VRVLYTNDLWSQRTFQPGRSGGCSWGYGDGGFLVANAGSQGWCYFDIWSHSYQGNVRIEVTAHLRSGSQNSGFGIKFGVPSRQSREFYLYEIAANGGHKLVQYRGQWSDLYAWKNDGVVRQGYGSANRLAVEIRGTTIHTILNGQRVGSARAPGDIRGHLGFLATQPGMQVVFKDLRVLGLPGSP
jgi:hypothetical protein